MRRSMNMKGFLLILGALFLVFFVGHRMLRGTLDEKTERETALRATLTRLEEENRDLNNQLSIVDTKDYIVSSAIENYNYMSRDDIRFTFSNPEALYAYSEEEIQILMDELAD